MKKEGLDINDRDNHTKLLNIYNPDNEPLTEESVRNLTAYNKVLEEKFNEEIKKLNPNITRHKKLQYKVTDNQKYIIIQLKRFSSNNGVQTKNNDKYEMNNNIQINNESNKIIKFKLRGYIFHSGGTTGGHYTYYHIKDDGNYTLYDDSSYYDNIDKGNNQNLGYIYLYERVDEPTTKRKYLKYKQKYVKLRDKLAYFVK